MNKKNLVRQKLSVMGSYHTPGCTHYIKRAKSATYTTPNNSIEHEVIKFMVCYLLKSQGYEFISEAVSNKEGYRRDVVCLNTGEIFEVETTPERAKRFEGTEVTVVKTWEIKNLKEVLEEILQKLREILNMP